MEASACACACGSGSWSLWWEHGESELGESVSATQPAPRRHRLTRSRPSPDETSRPSPDETSRSSPDETSHSRHHPMVGMQVSSRERKVAGALERSLELRDDLHNITPRIDAPQRENTSLPPLPNTRRLRDQAVRTNYYETCRNYYETCSNHHETCRNEQAVRVARKASRAHAEQIRERKRRCGRPKLVSTPCGWAAALSRPAVICAHVSNPSTHATR